MSYDGLRPPARLLTAVTAVAVAVAILAELRLWDAWRNTDPDYRGLNLFSYFTVQSNLIAAVTLLIGAYTLLTRTRLGRWFSLLRGAAVLYMLVTGLVYALLLQHNPDAHAALGFNLGNFMLHQFVPVFMVAQWLWWRPAHRITGRQSLLWLAFPVVWLGYTFLHAAIGGWYPYPFLDPSLAGGAWGVAAYVAGITAGFVLLGFAVAWVSRWRHQPAVAGSLERL